MSLDSSFDAFEDLPAIPRGVKRTYSQRQRPVRECDDTGLMTPPNSSSPPTSPVPIRFLSDFPASSKSQASMQSTARSFPALLQRSTNTMTPKPRYKAVKTITVPGKKAMIQMHLNLLPAYVTCKECGMSYTRTSPSDITLHTTFHSSHLSGLPLSSTLTLGDGIHKLAYNKTSERNMMGRCLVHIDRELSASLAPLDAKFSGFIMVKQSRIQSFILLQSIKQARIFHPATGEQGEEVQAVMGVSRMWTAKRSRGKGDIRKVLDTAIREFVHGCTLEKSDVAFTQLSDSGLKTVEKWNPEGRILVYAD